MQEAQTTMLSERHESVRRSAEAIDAPAIPSLEATSAASHTLLACCNMPATLSGAHKSPKEERIRLPAEMPYTTQPIQQPAENPAAGREAGATDTFDSRQQEAADAADFPNPRFQQDFAALQISEDHVLMHDSQGLAMWPRAQLPRGTVTHSNSDSDTDEEQASRERRTSGGAGHILSAIRDEQAARRYAGRYVSSLTHFEGDARSDDIVTIGSAFFESAPRS